jgi:ABC-type uncharacterized transport system permease subunit
MCRTLKFGYMFYYPVRICFVLERQYCFYATATSSKILSAIDLAALLVLIVFVIQFLHACHSSVLLTAEEATNNETRICDYEISVCTSD